VELHYRAEQLSPREALITPQALNPAHDSCRIHTATTSVVLRSVAAEAALRLP
jgi:hypothetical protein